MATMILWSRWWPTLICQPATMTHRGMPEEAQAKAGIHRNLLRLSVGLEEAVDLIADLQLGFNAIGARTNLKADEQG